MVLTSNLSAHKSREIRASINLRLDIWDRGIHTGLVRDALSEGSAREGRIERSDKEEEDCLAHSFHSTFLLGKMQQAVCWATDCRGGGGEVYSTSGFLHKDQGTSCK